MKRVNNPPKNGIRLSLILILILFLFIWYSQLTDISGEPISFFKKSFDNLGNMFNKDVQVSGNSPLQNFLIFSKKIDINKEWRDYNVKINEDYNKELNKNNFYTLKNNSNLQQNLVPTKGLKQVVPLGISLPFLKNLFEFLGRMFIVFGVFLFFVYFKKEKRKTFLNVVSISFLICLISAVFLPFFSFSYSLQRFYKQFLVVLSLFSPLGMFLILKPFLKKKVLLILTFFFIFYFLIFSGAFYQLTGGTGVVTKLNNIGFEYDMRYIHKVELSSASWFLKNNYGNELHIDNYANLRLLLSQSEKFKNIRNSDIITKIIKKDSYVYSSYSNSMNHITIRSFNIVSLSFNFPTDFLNENKNKVYNNGGSKIFR